MLVAVRTRGASAASEESAMLIADDLELEGPHSSPYPVAAPALLTRPPVTITNLTSGWLPPRKNTALEILEGREMQPQDLGSGANGDWRERDGSSESGGFRACFPPQVHALCFESTSGSPITPWVRKMADLTRRWRQ